RQRLPTSAVSAESGHAHLASHARRLTIPRKAFREYALGPGYSHSEVIGNIILTRSASERVLFHVLAGATGSCGGVHNPPSHYASLVFGNAFQRVKPRHRGEHAAASPPTFLRRQPMSRGR